MTMLFVLLNAVACFIIFWVCGTFLLARDRPDCMCQWALHTGLLTAMVGAFSSGLVPFVQPIVPPWWAVLLRGGIAIMAAAIYDRHFSIKHQAIEMATQLVHVPLTLHLWWVTRLAIARREAQRQSHDH